MELLLNGVDPENARAAAVWREFFLAVPEPCLS